MVKNWDSALTEQVKALAEQGLTIHAIARKVGLSESVTYDIIRSLDIEAPWKIRRRLRKQKEDEQRARQAAEKSRPNPQHLEIVSRYASGETLQQIANSIGRSRERIRQIITENGHSPKALRKATRDRELQRNRTLGDTVEAWIENHKGCTQNEVEQEFSCTWMEISGNIGTRARQLVFDPDQSAVEQNFSAQWTNEQAVNALQEASKHCTPLTKTAYDKLRQNGSVFGPSGSKIVHIYGAWTVACEAADVQCGATLRNHYTSRWSMHELIEAVKLFMCESESLSVEAYERWRASRTGLPSSVLLRAKLGTWTDIRKRVLQLFRNQWCV